MGELGVLSRVHSLRESLDDTLSAHRNEILGFLSRYMSWINLVLVYDHNGFWFLFGWNVGSVKRRSLRVLNMCGGCGDVGLKAREKGFCNPIS